MFRAVLSTTVLPLDGTYKVNTVEASTVNLNGCPHFVGHPDTKNFVESLGAVKAPNNLFEGLQVGEQAVCVPLAKPRAGGTNDHTVHTTVSDPLKDLTFRVITRVE